MSERPRRVFISCTTELRKFPREQSFVDAARAAVERAGDAVVHMETWTAADAPPGQVCAERVRECDVYVAVLGFRYGSPTREDPSRSYTELEFGAATEAHVPRLVFVVDDEPDVVLPREFFTDDEGGHRQQAFRRRVADAGLVRATFRSPRHLEILVFQALRDLDDEPEVTGTAGASDVSGLHHWQTSAGLTSNPRAGYLFTRRVEAIRRVSDWLLAPRSRPVCVVTGDPGSGKSAVLSWFVLQGRADERRRFPDADAYPPLPDDVLTAAVHARGRSLADIVELVAVQSGFATRNPDDLLAYWATQTTQTRLVIDAVDESPDARLLISRLVQPLLRRQDRLPVQLLLGARRHIARRLEMLVVQVDLDGDDVLDRVDVVEYVRRLLQAEEARRPAARHFPPSRTTRVAAAVARDAGRSFLVAQLVARSIVARGVLPRDDRRFPEDVQQAMVEYLDALPVERFAAEDLLRPLAVARGQGLPAPLWALLAGVLSGVPGRYSAVDVADLFRGPLASLVVTQAATAIGYQGGRSGPRLYRLFHEALDEYLETAPAAYPDAPAPGADRRAAVAAALIDAVPRDAEGDIAWERADDYVLHHLSGHAMGTPALPRLIRDASFLLHAERGSVIAALADAPSETTAEAHAYESVAQHLDTATPGRERAAYLALAATRADVDGPREFWRRGLSPHRGAAAWWPLAARWRPDARHRIVRQHGDSVTGVDAAMIFGDLVVLSASEDRSLALTVLPEAGTDLGRPGMVGLDLADEVAFDRPLFALTLAVVDGLPLAVLGDEDGDLQVVDLPLGNRLGQAKQPEGPAVTALASLPATSGAILVVGRADGTMEARRLLDLDVVARSEALRGSEIVQVEPVSSDTVVIASGAGHLWRWQVGAEAPARFGPDTTRATAITTVDLAGQRLVLSGHGDGWVRTWAGDGAGPLQEYQVLPDGLVAALAVLQANDRHLLLVGSEEPEIAVVDLDGWQLWPVQLTGHRDPVWRMVGTDVAGRPGVLGAGEDAAVHLWMLDATVSMNPHDEFAAAGWVYTNLCRNGEDLLAGAVDRHGRFAVLSALTGQLRTPAIGPAPGSTISASTLAVVTGHLWWAFGTELGALAVGNDTDVLWAEGGHDDWVNDVHLDVTRGQLRLVSVDTGGRAITWTLRDGQLRPERTLPLAGLDKITRAVVADASAGGGLVAADVNGTVGVWDLDDGRAAKVRSDLTDQTVRSARAYGPTIAIGTQRGDVVVAMPDRVVTRSATHRRQVTALALTGPADSPTVVSGGEDGRVLIWSAREPGQPPVDVDVGAPVTDLLLLREVSVAIATRNGAVVLSVPALRTVT